jgi:hypothetical protein
MDAHSMGLLAESLGMSHRILSLTILDHGDSETPSRPIPLDEHAEIMRECYRQLSFHPSVIVARAVT